MQQQPIPEPMIKEDPIERFMDWFVDATFEQVLKELEIVNPQK
jgi:hypothetical protein